MAAGQVDGVSRRTFLIGGLGTAAALSAGTYAWLQQRGYSVDPHPSPRGRGRPPAADLPAAPFDKTAAAVLAVLVDQLLPGDPSIGLPSGTEAGALAFLDRACRHRGLIAVRADVLKLCRDLNRRARGRFGRTYEQSTPEQRDLLLAEIRVDAATPARGRSRYRPQRALQTTLRIVLEGYLGHPRHGGNTDARVWDALDIPMPKNVRGHAH